MNFTNVYSNCLNTGSYIWHFYKTLNKKMSDKHFDKI